MREQGVAEFSYGEVTVKFSFQRPTPTPAEVQENSSKFDEYKRSLDTHLDSKSPQRAEDEHNSDLFWST